MSDNTMNRVYVEDILRRKDEDIASLRASVERLTRERDAATKLMEFWRAKSRERIAGLHFRRIVASVAVEMDQIGGGGSSASNVRAWSSRLSDALAGLPDDDAEATIARLAKVVRAAHEMQTVLHLEPTDGGCAVAMVNALSSLTAEDRRRAGIEG